MRGKSEKARILLPGIAQMKKKDNIHCLSAQLDFKFKMLPKESIPKNNTTSIPEMKNNVLISLQNKMLNYLMPLG